MLTTSQFITLQTSSICIMFCEKHVEDIGFFEYHKLWMPEIAALNI